QGAGISPGARENPQPHRIRRRRARDRTRRTQPPTRHPRRVPPPPQQGDSMKFRSDPAQIRGSIAPLMTPFTSDGAVDHESLTNLVNWQLASGSHGISIGGSTGEPSAQTVAERAD